jgi:hypothetical protein
VLEFEVVIPTRTNPNPAKGTRVSAAHWMQALRDGLAQAGEPPPPEDSIIDIDADGTIRMTVRRTGRWYIIRQCDSKPVAGPPAPAASGGAQEATTQEGPVAPKPPPPGTRQLMRTSRASDGRGTPGNEMPTIPEMAPFPGAPPRGAATVAPVEPAPAPTPTKTRPGYRRAPISKPLGTRVTGPGQKPNFHKDTRPFAKPRDGGDPDVVTIMCQALPPLQDGYLTREQLLDAALDLVWEHVGCDGVQLLEPVAGSSELRVAVALGSHAGRAARAILHREPWIAELLAQHTGTTRLSQVERTLRYDKPGRAPVIYPVSSLLWVPAYRQRRLQVVLVLVNSPNPAAFTDGETQAVEYLAGTLAQALAHR